MKQSYIVQGIEDDIMRSLRTGKPYRAVFVDSGAANDQIIDYDLELKESVNKRDRQLRFRTSGTIFPDYINLEDMDSIDTEEYNGCLFLHVGR